MDDNEKAIYILTELSKADKRIMFPKKDIEQALKMAINALEQTRWIPVSEKLPEIHQNVLLSLRSLEVEVGFRAETEPFFYCEGAYIELQNVLAWMPLSEPYKEKVYFCNESEE